MLGFQCRMARAGLALKVQALADAAQVSSNFITRLEGGEVMEPHMVALVRQTLEAAGMIFIDGNGEGPGVRLRKPRPDGDQAELDAELDEWRKSQDRRRAEARKQ